MTGRRALLAAGVSMALVLGGSAAAHAATVSPAASPKGCTNTATVPAGAVTGPVGDVDGDRRTDTQFYGVAGGHYVYGIRTAAGGVYSITDTLKGTGVHGGWTASLEGSNGPVTVIDDGRTAKLYAFRHCAFVQPQHAGGGAYTFSLGATSTTGTGVACNDQNGGPILLRATAKHRPNGRYDVVWAVLRVSADGHIAARQGGAGSSSLRWSNLKGSDIRVREARGSFCKGTQAKIEARTD